MIMTLTPTSNVNYECRCVIDNSMIQTAEFDWETSIQILDVADNKIKFVKVKDVSVYDHRIVLDDGKSYHIMHGLSV